MGTSSSNNGQKGTTPLVPSWLDDEIPNDGQIPQNEDGERFRIPRSDFTRYINSKGRDTSSLKRATSKYVSDSLKGSQNATKRLGGALKTSSNIFGFMNSVSRNGLNETLTRLNFANLRNHNPADILLELSDYFCPDGGSIDEGIARDAYFETLCMIPEDMIDLTNINDDMIINFTAIFSSNIIKGRLLNDIGLQIIKIPDSVSDIQSLEKQVFTYIDGAVRDAIYRQNVKNLLGLDIDIRATIESIYQAAYEILELED